MCACVVASEGCAWRAGGAHVQRGTYSGKWCVGRGFDYDSVASDHCRQQLVCSHGHWKIPRRDARYHATWSVVHFDSLPLVFVELELWL